MFSVVKFQCGEFTTLSVYNSISQNVIQNINGRYNESFCLYAYAEASSFSLHIMVTFNKNNNKWKQFKVLKEFMWAYENSFISKSIWVKLISLSLVRRYGGFATDNLNKQTFLDRLKTISLMYGIKTKLCSLSSDSN